jgi:hypothetical protein
LGVQPDIIDRMYFWEYTYMVQDIKLKLEERKKQQEAEKDKGNKQIPNYAKNPKSYKPNYPKMSRYK